MRYSVLGFNQENTLKIEELNIDDLLLLDYICNAIASPTMKHIVENDIAYVWLYHKRVLEDLPILHISEDRLKRKIKKLVDLGLLQSKQLYEEGRRGSQSYYAITEKCEQLRYISGVENNTCYEHQVLKTTRNDIELGVENNTSYKQLNFNDKQLKEIVSKDTITDFEFGVKSTSKPKNNLYSKCISSINDFTTNLELRNALVDYLSLRLEMKDKPLYPNSWKGLLNKLNREFKEEERIDVVRQSIERAYASFFPVNKGFNTSKNTVKDIEHLPENHPKVDKKKLQEDIANGNVTYF